MSRALLSAAAVALLASTAISQSHQIIIPPYPAEAITETQWISGPEGLDAPKNRPINQTTYEWWYFDAVQAPSENAGQHEQAMVSMIFYTTGADGFDLLQLQFPGNTLPSTNVAHITLAWPNGTSEDWLIPAGDAVFTVDSDGTSADYTGIGCAFTGAPDLSSYAVAINAREHGIVGSLFVQSDAPAHYPCGRVEPGQNMQTAPHAGWVNAIPDGSAIAEFTVRGEKLQFRGRGYHDHNWGDRTFSPRSGYAYWGHGRVGGYAIVWLSVLPAHSTEEHVSAYVARDGELLSAGCAPGDILVRPYGANSTYPPSRTTGPPTGFQIGVDLPDAGGRLELRAEYLHIVEDVGVYRRYTGRLSGELGGVDLGEDGVALWEQFSFLE